jgi:pimeloyl-ACP methyl ester carboxylesterase
VDDDDLLRLERCTPGIQQQATSKNLGYGNLYYGLVRLLKPKHVLVIGSGYGFAPAVMALALQHNGRGTLTFVDPSMSGSRDGHNAAHGGSGSWDTPEQVRARFACAGVRDKTLRHFKETNREFFALYEKRGLPPIDLALIDGAHDGQNASYDLVQVSQHLRLPAVVLMHDTTHFLNRVGYMGVSEVLGKIKGRVEQLTFPGSAGLSVLRFTNNANLEISGLPPPSVVWPFVGAIGLGVFLGRIFLRGSL